MKRIINKFITLFILFLLSNCSAQWHAKRAVLKASPQIVIDELEKLYPDFFMYKDTVIIDTMYLHYRVIDTVKVMNKIDTLVVNNNNYQIKVIRHYDTVYVKGVDKSDTIIKRVIVPKYIVKKNIIEKRFDLKWLLVGVFIGEILIFLIIIFIRYGKYL